MDQKILTDLSTHLNKKVLHEAQQTVQLAYMAGANATEIILILCSIAECILSAGLLMTLEPDDPKNFDMMIETVRITHHQAKSREQSR